MKSITTFLATTLAALAATTGSASAAICAIGAPCNVPEPGSLALVGIALVGAVLVARKGRK